jgi:isoleucyl-tRNA synthetase
VDWQTEVPFGEDLFKQITDPYRRLRNTFRIMLGNLDGFDVEKQSVAYADMPLLDRWVLERLDTVIAECTVAYENFEFRKVFNSINNFCTHDLSALYVDITKDRMYCDSVDSPRRRASQTAFAEIFLAISKLLAPVLAYTADEAWEHCQFTDGSVHTQDFPTASGYGEEATKTVNQLLKLREQIQQKVEEQVQAKAFNKNNEADVTVPAPEDERLQSILTDRLFVTEFFIVADLNLGEEFAAKKTEHSMCPRCRRYEPLVTDVCQRCSEVG